MSRRRAPEASASAFRRSRVRAAAASRLRAAPAAARASAASKSSSPPPSPPASRLRRGRRRIEPPPPPRFRAAGPAEQGLGFVSASFAAGFAAAAAPANPAALGSGGFEAPPPPPRRRVGSRARRLESVIAGAPSPISSTPSSRTPRASHRSGSNAFCFFASARRAKPPPPPPRVSSPSPPNPPARRPNAFAGFARATCFFATRGGSAAASAAPASAFASGNSARSAFGDLPRRRSRFREGSRVGHRGLRRRLRRAHGLHARGRLHGCCVHHVLVVVAAVRGDGEARRHGDAGGRRGGLAREIPAWGRDTSPSLDERSTAGLRCARIGFRQPRACVPRVLLIELRLERAIQPVHLLHPGRSSRVVLVRLSPMRPEEIRLPHLEVATRRGHPRDEIDIARSHLAQPRARARNLDIPAARLHRGRLSPRLTL